MCGSVAWCGVVFEVGSAPLMTTDGVPSPGWVEGGRCVCMARWRWRRQVSGAVW